MQEGFSIVYYLYPLLIFGFINTFLVGSFLFSITFILRKKLLVVIGGLLLYIFYMVILLFSNSPFMAGAMPQSLETQQISAILDPFGLSSYFLNARLLTVEKKYSVCPYDGLFAFQQNLLFNYIYSFSMVDCKKFSFSNISKQKAKKHRPKMILNQNFSNPDMLRYNLIMEEFLLYNPHYLLPK